jgi:N-methylhydantoinase A
MSVGRGHDPRDFVLVAFGGAGPLHGAAIINETGIPRCIMPPLPGVTSAIGCIDADVQYDFVQSIREPLAAVDIDAVNKLVEAYVTEGTQLIERGGVPVTGVSAVVEAEMHYVGQRHPIRVTVATPLKRDAVASAFDETYQQRYGSSLDAPSVLVDLNCRVVGHRPRPETAPAATERRAWDPSITDRRPVYFGGEWRDTAIIERTALEVGMYGEGPAIVEQDDTTSIIPPGMTAHVDGAGNLIVEVRS